MLDEFVLWKLLMKTGICYDIFCVLKLIKENDKISETKSVLQNTHDIKACEQILEENLCKMR